MARSRVPCEENSRRSGILKKMPTGTGRVGVGCLELGGRLEAEGRSVNFGSQPELSLNRT